MGITGLLASAMGENIDGAVLQTLALALGAGAFLTVIAKQFKVPGIVLLLFGGILLGPEFIGWVRPSELGGTLNVLVSLAVGLILFEGGLTLNIDGYRSAGAVIRRLLTVGVVVTWGATALAIYLLYGFDPTFCMLAGSLVIVTGPTVIQPILKRIRLNWNLHHTLHWEGVLIDPIGVFAAVLAFEWAVGGGGEQALLNLGLRIVGGLAIGYTVGEFASWLLRRRFVPEELLNVFMVGIAILVFAVTEALIAEGGLLGVTVAGLVIGARKPPSLKSIVEFKSVITDLLIGFVFILLTARLELVQFAEFGIKGFLLVGLVIAVVRPLAIGACTFGSEINWRERVFLSWVAPRGVVAASMASLFALTLAEQPQVSAALPKFLESFVYSVIFVTVVLQGFSAGPLASLLRVLEKPAQGWIIVGAHALGRAFASFLRDVRGVPVILVDGNRKAVLEAQQEGHAALMADARETDELEERDELQGIGRLLAFTDNEDLNELLCKKWEPTFGKQNVFRWSDTKSESERATGHVLWTWMPKPSMISSELVLGEAAIVELEGERLESPRGLAALLSANANEVLLDPGPSSKLKTAKSAAPRTLYLQREADYLLNALRPDLVVRLEVEDKAAVFRSLADVVASAVPSLDADEIFDDVSLREATMPTGLGRAVALPHTRLAKLTTPICAVAQLRPPVHFDGAEDEAVSLVFLLLSPKDQPELHLAILGEIARLVADATVRDQLVEAHQPDEMIGLIRRYRRQHTPFADARG